MAIVLLCVATLFVAGAGFAILGLLRKSRD
jgi:hypothetical protein